MIGVRRAAAADIDVLVDLMREFYAEADFPLDAAWAADAFSTLIADPALGAVWIISADDAPIGHVVLTVRYAMEFGGLSGYIDDLFVRKAHRRQGAATAGLGALVAECTRPRLQVAARRSRIRRTSRLWLCTERLGLAPGADERLQLKAVLPGRA